MQAGETRAKIRYSKTRPGKSRLLAVLIAAAMALAMLPASTIQASAATYSSVAQWHAAEGDEFFTHDGSGNYTWAAIGAPEGLSLTVASGETLTITGTLGFEEPINIEGKLTVAAGGVFLCRGSYLAGDIENNGTLNMSVWDDEDLVYSGAISGTGAVQISHRDQTSSVLPNTAALTGNNTYTGSTTVNGVILLLGGQGGIGPGSLQLGSYSRVQAAADVTIANPIVLSGGSTSGIIVPGGVSATLSGTISGTNLLNKFGEGTLTLTGNNSFTGGATVEAGALVFGSNGSAGSGTITVRAGAALTVPSGVSIGHTGNISNSGALDVGGAFTQNGNLNNTSLGTIGIGPGGSWAQGGTNTINNGEINIGAGASWTQDSATANNGTINIGAGGAWTQNAAVTNNGFVNNDGTIDGAYAGGFESISGPYVSLDLWYRALNLENAGQTLLARSENSYTYSGTGSLADELTFAPGESLTVTGALTVISPGFISSSGGALAIASGGKLVYKASTLSGNIANGGTLEFSPNNALDYNGVISGAGELVKNGANVTLWGANTYTGETKIESGTLILGASYTLPAGKTISASSGGTLAIGSGATLTNNGAIALAGTGSLAINDGGAFDHNGSLDTEATCFINVNGNFNGSITGLNCTLQIGNGAADGNVTGNIGTVAGSKVVFYPGHACIYEGIVSGAGALEKSGGESLSLLGENTYTGITAVNAGTLLLANNYTIGNASDLFVVAGATLANAAKLTVEGGATINGTFENANAGFLAVESGGIWMQNGPVTQGGAVNNNGGTIDGSNASALTGPPGAPAIGTAVAGAGEATVAFTAPAANGGSDITGYTVTSWPGGITAAGTESPIAVTGLANGETYTFTVKAVNGIGAGPASEESSPVTPQENLAGVYFAYEDDLLVPARSLVLPARPAAYDMTEYLGTDPEGYALKDFYDISFAAVKDKLTKAGKLTVKKPGTTVVAATLTGKAGTPVSGDRLTATVTVKSVAGMKGMKLNQSKEKKLAAGKSFTAKVTYSPSNVSIEKAIWQSSNEEVAKVNPVTGKVTAVGPGTAYISFYAMPFAYDETAAAARDAIAGGGWFECEYPVFVPSTAIDIFRIEQGEAGDIFEKVNGRTLRLATPGNEAYYLDEGGDTILIDSEFILSAINNSITDDETIVWKSSDTKKKIVEIVQGSPGALPSGDMITVKEKGKGTATLTATARGGKKATVKVKVANPAAVELLRFDGPDRLPITLRAGEAPELADTWLWAMVTDLTYVKLEHKNSKPTVAQIYLGGVDNTQDPDMIEVKSEKAGKTTVSATAQYPNSAKKTAKIDITVVQPAKALKITNTPEGNSEGSPLALKKGKTFTAKTKLNDGYPAATNKGLAWESSDKAVASVSSKGVIKGVGAGVAKITVKSKDDNAVMAELFVIVSVQATKVAIEQAKFKMQAPAEGQEGDTAMLSAVTSPAQALLSPGMEQLKWTLSKPGVVEIVGDDVGDTVCIRALNDNLTPLKSSDKVKIVATAPGGKKATIEVTVAKAAQKVENMRLAKTATWLLPGKSETLKLAFNEGKNAKGKNLYPAPANKNAAWKVEAEYIWTETGYEPAVPGTIATVTQKGKVTVRAFGYAVVSAEPLETAGTDKDKKTCTVYCLPKL